MTHEKGSQMTEVKVGDIVTGTVEQILPYGAFVRLSTGQKAMIHISELAHEYVKKVEDIPKELRRCIKSITQHETQFAKYLKLELHSPVAALGMLAKYHNLFKRTISSKGLVVVIQRPPMKVEIRAPIDVTPKPNGNGNGHAKPPQVTFIRPTAGKTTATIAPGTTNGNGRGH